MIKLMNCHFPEKLFLKDSDLNFTSNGKRTTKFYPFTSLNLQRINVNIPFNLIMVNGGISEEKTFQGIDNAVLFL